MEKDAKVFCLQFTTTLYAIYSLEKKMTTAIVVAFFLFRIVYNTESETAYQQPFFFKEHRKYSFLLIK